MKDKFDCHSLVRIKDSPGDVEYCNAYGIYYPECDLCRGYHTTDSRGDRLRSATDAELSKFIAKAQADVIRVLYEQAGKSLDPLELAAFTDSIEKEWSDYLIVEVLDDE